MMTNDKSPLSPITGERYSDSQRMTLRSYIELAGEVIAPYWPMRTFVHHNPLHGLESLPFEQAIQQGFHLFGGRGYLPNAQYRYYLDHGRLTLDDLRSALAPLARPQSITVGGQRWSHLDLLTLSLAHGVTDFSENEEDATLVAERARWLAQASEACDPLIPESFSHDNDEPSPHETLATWCDRSLGTRLVELINREMVKWCSAFLDEGEAAWAMPHRELSFYGAWRKVAQEDWSWRLLGIAHAAEKLRALPDRPEDALLDLLDDMYISPSTWESYFSQHLAALPGWVGYIKWRSRQDHHPWQQAYPIDLTSYLAVRLFYERELVRSACYTHLAIAGTDYAIRHWMRDFPAAYRLRRAYVAGQLPAELRRAVKRLLLSPQQESRLAWEQLGHRYDEYRKKEKENRRFKTAARYLVRLAHALGLDSLTLDHIAPSDLRTLLTWLGELSVWLQGQVWLEALERANRRQLLELMAAARAPESTPSRSETEGSRPLAQLVFCIDVRSEVFRRHVESLGGYETFGLAGFFGVPLDFQPFGAAEAIAHCPVLLKPKNLVREVPRSYQDLLAERHRLTARWKGAAYELLHDLKQNIITPYVMVEAIGWFFSFPFFGRTLAPVWYDALKRWIAQLFAPPLATTLTVEKLSPAEAEAMVEAEQLAMISRIFRERFGSHHSLSPSQLTAIRQKAIGDGSDGKDPTTIVDLPPEVEAAFLAELRERHHITGHGMSARLQRLTRTGFSVSEQAYFVEAALRLIGLTSNFSRVVVFCAHGSTSDNNPYESALDCGACGGNQGLPNARAIAMMANNPAVRQLLKARGIVVPSDTHFFAAQHDTTTDLVRLVDLEDVPPTHRHDLRRLMNDLDTAGQWAIQERIATLPGLKPPTPLGAREEAYRRSRSWSEVRPEWGLSKNSLMVIGRRTLTNTLNLQGRAFLHSYDYRQDQTGKYLEAIMTAPLVVAQWINMEHYFSTVDNEIYGSGSKVYHNVVGRIGVMTGASSDLRLGLPAQTVFDGANPYHEPIRLLTIVEAPRDRIESIIHRHFLLDRLFNLGWIALVAWDPADGQFHRYCPRIGWILEPSNQGVYDHDELDIASHEGNQDRRAG